MSAHPAQLMPIVSVPSVDAARDFYVDRLGFDHLMAVVGSDGALEFCTVLREGARIMFNRGTESSTAAPSTAFYLETTNIDAYHRQLLDSGLNPSPLEDMWWGDRVTIIEDLNGYKLWFYQQVGDPIPPEGMKIV